MRRDQNKIRAQAKQAGEMMEAITAPKCAHEGEPCSEPPAMLMLWDGKGPYPVCSMHGNALIALAKALGNEALYHPLFSDEDREQQPSIDDIMTSAGQEKMQNCRAQLEEYARAGHVSAQFLCRLMNNNQAVPVVAMIRTTETIRATLEVEGSLGLN